MSKERNKVKEIMKSGDAQQIRSLFAFDSSTPTERIYKKYKLYSRRFFSRYFPTKSADYHKDMIMDTIKSYRGEENVLNLAYRGASKTSPTKVFLCFVLLNDLDHFRKYIKVNSKDGENSAQFVTDVYNLIVELEYIYGDVFATEGKTKRQERMGNFIVGGERKTVIDQNGQEVEQIVGGIKVTAGTVGKTQRGHVQDAYRPDWIIFDDIEDSESVDSAVMTEKIIKKVDEAIQGLSVNGTYLVLGNYISDIGVMENIKGKDVKTRITPILDSNGKPTWPQQYSMKKIESIKKNAEDWYGEYMCDPVSGAKREFKKDLFQYITWEDLKQKNTLCYITIDSAVSKRDSADYTGITINWVDTENKWYFKSYRVKINSAELFELLFELYKHYKPEYIGIEKVSFVEAIKPFLDEEMRKRNIYLPIKMLDHGGTKKETRIRGLLPRYEAGSIFHIKGECNDLEAELLRFPKSKNDDTMDSAAYQPQIADKPYEYDSDDDDYDDYYDEDIGI